MQEPQTLTACVEFATGAVRLLGYKLATATDAAARVGGYSSYILVMLRRERCRLDSLLWWEHTFPAITRLKGGQEACVSTWPYANGSRRRRSSAASFRRSQPRNTWTGIRSCGRISGLALPTRDRGKEGSSAFSASGEWHVP